MAIDSFTLAIYTSLFSLAFGIASFKIWQYVEKLQKLVPLTVDKLQHGHAVMVLGRVIAPFNSLVESPYSQHKCVCFASTIQQKRAHFMTGAGFGDPTWDSLGTSLRSAPFLLEDHTGTIFIIASRANLSLKSVFEGELDIMHKFKGVSPAMRWIAKRIAPIQALWVKECLLRPGDTVFISGISHNVGSLDKQLIPEQYKEQTKFVLKGENVKLSTTVPAASLPYYEKCFWFSAATTTAGLAILVILLIQF
jgi:hypothetical protein